jgi:hyperosmotically inducible periplasmic protein
MAQLRITPNCGALAGTYVDGRRRKPMKNAIKCLVFTVCLATAVSVVTFTSGCSGDRYSRSTGETIDDASLTAKVKSKLLADPQVKGLDVNVNTFRGTVQLTGFVDSPDQKMLAEQVTKQVSGVQSVKNDLIVKMEEPAGVERQFQDKR